MRTHCIVILARMSGMADFDPLLDLPGSTGGGVKVLDYLSDMVSTTDGSSPDLRRGVRRHAQSTSGHAARTVEQNEHPLGPASVRPARQGTSNEEHMENASQTTATASVKSERSFGTQKNLTANREVYRGRPDKYARPRRRDQLDDSITRPVDALDAGGADQVNEPMRRSQNRRDLTGVRGAGY